jgi:hypothetical protein
MIRLVLIKSDCHHGLKINSSTLQHLLCSRYRAVHSWVQSPLHRLLMVVINVLMAQNVHPRLFFRMYLNGSIWTHKWRSAYIHVGEPSELKWL